MSLKEKALKFEKELSSVPPLDAPESITQERIPSASESIYDSSNLEKILLERANQIELSEISSNKKLDQDLFLSSDDLHSSSRPVIHGLAQDVKIESLLNLIELSKELSASSDEAQLLDTIIFTLIGQLGIKEIAIFFKEEKNFVLKATQGFVIQLGFKVSLDSSLLKTLSEENGIIYTQKLVSRLKSLEKIWFGSLNSDLLVPILDFEKIVGFIILGKTIAQMDYNLEDLMYLKISGELLGSFYQSIQKLMRISKQEIKLRDQARDYNILDRYTRSIQKAKNFAEIDQIFLEIIIEEYQVSKFIFLLKQDKMFVPNLYKDVDEKTIQRITTSIRESWIFEMKKQTGLYEYTNFLENTNFTKKFSAEDLSLITKVLILPLHFANELEGLFILLNISHEMNTDRLSYLSVIINTYYWSFLSHKNKTNTIGNLEDPLFDLRNLIHDYENDLETKNIPYSLIYITVENASRLAKLKNKKFYNNQRAYLKRTCDAMISEKEFCLEIFPAKYLLILKGEGKKRNQNIIKNLETGVKLEKYQPIMKYKILNRPEEKPISIHSFLFD